MRSADLVTLLRIPLLLLLIYSIAIRFSAVVVLLLLAVLFISDAADGYFAFSGEHSLSDFARYLFEETHVLSRRERKRLETPKHAAYLDIAIDRTIEYGLWLTFIFLSLLPWFVFVILFIRNTLADALMLRKGKNFSMMHTAFGRLASSHASRGAYAIIKAVNFGYLSLVAVANWPLNVGYVLTAVVVIYSLARGTAEIYESLL